MKKILRNNSSKKYFQVFLGIKIFYLFIAVFIFAQFTVLGDTDRYLAGGLGDFTSAVDVLTSPTSMMDAVGGVSGWLLGGVGGNLPFIILSVIGIYLPFKKISLSRSEKLAFCAFISFPSFGVWTSIASKESMAVFYLGVILSTFIDLDSGRKIENKILFVLSIYLCFLFKPHYMLPLSFLFLYLFVNKCFYSYQFSKLLIFIIFFLLVFLMLYCLRDVANEYAYIIPKHFDSVASASRENNIWVDDYDIYRNALYGMYIAYVGPTLSEALNKPAYFFSWLESMIIVFAFIVFLIRDLFFQLLFLKVNFKMLWITFFVIMGFLFVHYPFGVINFGSAIRYKQGFYPFLLTLVFYLRQKNIQSVGNKMVCS